MRAGLLFLVTFSGVCCSAVATPVDDLLKSCRQVQNSLYISEVENFIQELKRFLQEKSNAYIKGFRNQEPACIQQAEAFYDLEAILIEKDNVCKKTHIDAIEKYHLKHIKPTGAKLIKKFFETYVDQVSIICRRNLLSSLNLVDSQEVVNRDDYLKVMPWSAVSDPCQMIERKKYGLVDQTENEFYQTDIHCKAVQALESIRSIDELVTALGIEDKDKSKSTAGSNPEAETGEKSSLMLSLGKRKPVEDMLQACVKFENIYDQTIMPIVRLARLGYNPEFQKFDSKCYHEKTIQRWFTITLICQSMLKSRILDGTDEIDNLQELSSAESHEVMAADDKATGRRLSDGLGKGKLSYNFMNKIDDYLWISEYKPSKLQRITSKLLNTKRRVFNMDDTGNSALHKEKVAHVKHVVMQLAMVSLSVVGLLAGAFYGN